MSLSAMILIPELFSTYLDENPHGDIVNSGKVRDPFSFYL
jgi:hypothetical protein